MDMSEDHNLSFTIHPLVLLNISQHFTRVRAQRHREGEKQAPHPVAGALLGKTSTRSIEIRDSFEVPAKCENGRLVSIDSQYLLNKEEHLIESKVTEYEVNFYYLKLIEFNFLLEQFLDRWLVLDRAVRARNR